LRRKVLLITVLVLLLLFTAAPLISLTASAEENAEDSEVETADVQPTATIFSDGFEGAWLWTRGDLNSAGGYDYWSVTTYRDYSGSRSAWCAQIGSQSVPTTIWTEGFEHGSWPGAWIRGDLNSVSGLDTWDLYNVGYSGSKSAWCAGHSDHPYGSNKYDNSMQAYMYRTVDLRRYSSVTISYRYWVHTEPDYDKLYVRYRIGSGWYDIDPHHGHLGGWFLSTVSIPTTANAVGFFFYSDYNNVDTGAWVDAVTLSGTPAANSAIHKYDNNMAAYMYRSVDLSSYSSVTLSYRYWLQSETDYDRLYVYYRIGSSQYATDMKQGNSGGWQYDTTSIPNTATGVGFYFTSDSNILYEGAYVDDVVLTGITTKEDTVLTLGFTPNPVGVGATCTLEGTLKTVGGSAVTGADVTVEYSTDGGATWHYAWTLNTWFSEVFAQSFTAPGTPGNYLVRARYAGSASYNPSSRTETLTVTAAAQPTVEIWTNKAAYAKGETLTVYIQGFNTGPATTVRVNVWFGLPGGGTYMYETYYTGTLPGYYTSPVYVWKSVTIPYSAASGTYSVNAEMRNPSTNALIDSDTYYFTIS